MKVDFKRLTWENYPSTETPINADNLNRLEEGVAGLYSDMAGIEEGIDSFKDETSAQVGAMQTRLTTMEGDIDSFQEITLGQVGTMQTRITSMQSGLPTIVGEQIDNKFGDDIGDNVTSWLTEHVTPSGSAVVVDDTLAIAGAAADAKKTGDKISGLKEELNTLDSSLFNNSVSIPRLTGNTYWTFGYEIVAETGANISTNRGCRTAYAPLSEPLRIVLDNPDYNFVVWVYTGQSVASAIYSPTKKYTDDAVLIQPLSTPAYFRIGVERKDRADLTTDYADTTSDAYKIITAVKTYTMSGRMCVNKIACFGDSIMLGRDGNGSGAARTEYTIPKAIAKRLGCVCDNYAVSGQGYVAKDSVPGAYSAISAVDLTKYNAVVMCFGVNDGYHVLGEWNSTDETTIMGQFNKIVNYIYTQNKQIRVIVFAPFNGRNVGTFPDYWYGERNGEYVSRKILSDTLKRACDYYWIPYVEQYDCPINPLNITEALPDGAHPSNDYYRLLSDWVAAKVNGLL